MSLQENIKDLRMKALLSQEDFAKILNVSVGTINRWENGKTLPNLTAMRNIKQFCENNSYPFIELEEKWIEVKKEAKN